MNAFHQEIWWVSTAGVATASSGDRSKI